MLEYYTYFVIAIVIILENTNFLSEMLALMVMLIDLNLVSDDLMSISVDANLC